MPTLFYLYKWSKKPSSNIRKATLLMTLFHNSLMKIKMMIISLFRSVRLKRIIKPLSSCKLRVPIKWIFLIKCRLRHQLQLHLKKRLFLLQWRSKTKDPLNQSWWLFKSLFLLKKKRLSKMKKSSMKKSKVNTLNKSNNKLRWKNKNKKRNALQPLLLRTLFQRDKKSNMSKLATRSSKKSTA